MEKHPEYEITCLVRNSDKGAKIAGQYAKVRLVYGTLDDSEILENEAEKADIILSTHKTSGLYLVFGTDILQTLQMQIMLEEPPHSSMG